MKSLNQIKNGIKSRLNSLRIKISRWPVFAQFSWAFLRRLRPVSSVFGTDRGLPVDRYYIEQFLKAHAKDIKGDALEIESPLYINKYGQARLRPHVLHAVEGNPHATLVGDLETGEGIPKEAYDCMILTQTFLVIYDVAQAIAHCHAALKPGGVLLVTIPGISQISRYDMDRWGDFWRFTNASAQRLFSDIFGENNVTVSCHGNVLTACAFLQGLAKEDLKQKELDFHDPNYQLLITVRAVKKT